MTHYATDITNKKHYSIVLDTPDEKERLLHYLQRYWRGEAWHFTQYFDKLYCGLFLTPETARIIENMLPRILAD